MFLFIISLMKLRRDMGLILESSRMKVLGLYSVGYVASIITKRIIYYWDGIPEIYSANEAQIVGDFR